MAPPSAPAARQTKIAGPTNPKPQTKVTRSASMRVQGTAKLQKPSMIAKSKEEPARRITRSTFNSGKQKDNNCVSEIPTKTAKLSKKAVETKKKTPETKKKPPLRRFIVKRGEQHSGQHSFECKSFREENNISAESMEIDSVNLSKSSSKEKKKDIRE